MKLNGIARCALFLSAFALPMGVGCTTGGPVDDDPGTKVNGANGANGGAADAGAFDSGFQPADSGPPPADAGTPPPADSGPAPDAGPAADSGPAPDAGGGGGNGADVTITELRGMAPGAIDRTLRDVYVTYVREVGYTVQKDAAGPAIYVYTNAAPGVSVGNMVTIGVTEVDDYNGLAEITGSSVVSNDNGTYDVDANLSQDISTGAGTALSEDLESELVNLTGVSVIEGCGGRNWTVEYGTGPVTAELYAYDSTGICAGVTLDINRAVVSEFNAAYDISMYYETDFSLTGGNCPAQDTTMDNWDFEDWSQSDPPPGFSSATCGFSATQETTTVNGGSSSMKLTWDDTSTQRIETLHHHPVTPGNTYTCGAQVYDNDPQGRVRIHLVWFDGVGGVLGNTANDAEYSTDQAAWQALTSDHMSNGPIAAPTGAATATCAIRMYDEGTFTEATVYVDDLYITP
jgi:hypothetical protein